ncbi:MAG: hypothetical protein ACXABY_16525 [Candidatus Thorarchaeota archaeon]
MSEWHRHGYGYEYGYRRGHGHGHRYGYVTEPQYCYWYCPKTNTRIDFGIPANTPTDWIEKFADMVAVKLGYQLPEER